ncbi:MAG: hypothetical protein A2521_17380 [Deltaproteobacteria bacterium RIFOXYD12_FULL_57_12]|nr:MAG: hypothetical protein A2521_17380 [Deltaproteobacteria bacterium RIFOXYD12_FULL_57_12]
MATREFCANVSEELEIWSNKLHELSGRIDRVPSIDKFRLQPYIEELHIIITELDDRLCEMVPACPTVEGQAERMSAPRVQLGDHRTERFDYDFGG